jgi:5-methyltetrahydrofolate--homocysteine methyltransferase
VDIILTNNGFTVVNLGIKVASERLIQEVAEHQPDLIGLSGLLVKSAQQMVLTAGDLRAAGIDTPLLVGGAALSRRFTHKKIAAAYDGLCTYASDAMTGLKLAERIVDAEERSALALEVREMIVADSQEGASTGTGVGTRAPARGARAVSRDVPVPPPPDTDRHLTELDLDEVWAYLNPQMLYGRHLGLRGAVTKHERDGDEKYLKLKEVVDDLKALARDGAMCCRAVWRFLPAEASGETLRLLDPEGGGVAAEWPLPRQEHGDRLCLTDYVLDGDHVALFVTTAGEGVMARVEEWKVRGEYLMSHTFAALALETAEAAAELLHARLRTAWGIPDPEGISIRDVLTAKYRGKRYSFGYPACPDLAGQRPLFDLLRPEEAGVRLTEGDMMEPEASVSALVFHHPDARYFRA